MGDKDYDTDSYHGFGDVEDIEMLSSDAGQHKNGNQETLSASSTSQKAHFLIKSNEYLSGYKERVLGEQIEKYE